MGVKTEHCSASKICGQRMKEFIMFHFQETLEKNLHYMPDYSFQQEIMLQHWMWICRIHRHCCRKCGKQLKSQKVKKIMIALLREELTGQGNRLSDLSLRECFIKSSIKCPQQKLWMVRETFG